MYQIQYANDEVYAYLKWGEREWLNFFGRKFFPGMNLRYNVHQQVGCAVDAKFINPYSPDKGVYAEFKHDKYSKNTDNFFFEVAQRTKNSGWKSSGVMLAVEQSDVLLYVTYRKKLPFICLSLLDPKKLLPYLESLGSKPIETNPGVNGNPPGSYTKGHVVWIPQICRDYNLLRYER